MTHFWASQDGDLLNQCLQRKGGIMGKAVELRQDYDGDELRRLARQSIDGDQTRRLLALAAI